MSMEERPSEYRLDELGNDGNMLEGNLASAVSSLPPADGGRAAWLFLFGSFLIEMFLWGRATYIPMKPPSTFHDSIHSPVPCQQRT